MSLLLSEKISQILIHWPCSKRRTYVKLSTVPSKTTCKEMLRRTALNSHKTRNNAWNMQWVSWTSRRQYMHRLNAQTKRRILFLPWFLNIILLQWIYAAYIQYDVSLHFRRNIFSCLGQNIKNSIKENHMGPHTYAHSTCVHTVLEVWTLKEAEQDGENKLEGRMGFKGAYVQYPPTGCVCRRYNH